MASLRVTLIPVLKDNYTYLLADASTGNVGVVDPSRPSRRGSWGRTAGGSTRS